MRRCGRRATLDQSPKAAADVRSIRTGTAPVDRRLGQLAMRGLISRSRQSLWRAADRFSSVLAATQVAFRVWPEKSASTDDDGHTWAWRSRKFVAAADRLLRADHGRAISGLKGLTGGRWRIDSDRLCVTLTGNAESCLDELNQLDECTLQELSIDIRIEGLKRSKACNRLQCNSPVNAEPAFNGRTVTNPQ